MAQIPAAGWSADSALQAYLLGTVDFDEMMLCQRRLVYEVSGERSQSLLFLCEHPPLISVGRGGSREHIGIEPAELAAREWPVRWVNRGGGCLLHLPGQLAIYSVLALDRMGLGLQCYLDRLHAVLSEVLTELSTPAERHPGRAGIWSNGRLIAHIGVAVRDWVAYFGAAINIQPDLEPFRRVRCAGADEPPMTSIARERREPVRAATVRQWVVASFARHFGFQRISLFHHHPVLTPPVISDAVATRSG